MLPIIAVLSFHKKNYSILVITKVRVPVQLFGVCLPNHLDSYNYQFSQFDVQNCTHTCQSTPHCFDACKKWQKQISFVAVLSVVF